MKKKSAFMEKELNDLAIILNNNKETDFLNANLSDARFISGLDWQDLKKKKTATTASLQAYQRLKKIIPKLSDNAIFSLLKSGIHAALQIAGIPKIKFIKDHAADFENEVVTAEQFYNKALSIRSKILLKYIRTKQNKEPHFNRARINPG
jgi:hypothetical protein